MRSLDVGRHGRPPQANRQGWILENAIEADPIAEFREGIHDIDICDQTATRMTGQAE